MEVQLSHACRIDPLEDQCMFYAGRHIPVGSHLRSNVVVTKQEPTEVPAILVCDAGVLPCTHVPSRRSLLWTESSRT
jgi:hypothetical protein